ncbi:phosphotransferase enzyme family protein [Novosphingobium sp. FSW06-99]|uniref:phosphotransferase enzyme family protein n=1 Tax=Novosphingobium sp. FSW06-99 TaxID=1739113 RepID=UPI00076D60B4|nr:phosphotransferase [Novosphingobium sp. FSW06-99]KUR75273.1 aminoglycoside phosphotransferase [Novosphingobium sp. FSW06-99]
MARPAIDHGPDGGHLVHGMGLTLEAPAWPAITVAEAQAVLARFPAAGPLVALHWHSPRPFSAAALVETGAGAFILKRHHQHVRTPATLAPEHRFMAHLRAAGLPVPDIVMADTGASAIGQDAWTYELHRTGAGLDLYRDRHSWTPFLHQGHAHAAGVALGRMHLAAQGFNAPDRGPQPLIASFTILPSPDPLAAAEAYVAARPALGAFLADKPWRPDLARLLGALGDGLPARLAQAPRLWTHNDWHPSNLLWSTDGAVSAVFDFGLATQTCALHDLATAIERTAISWLQLREGRADDAGALALLGGYRTVMPLTGDDIATLARLLPLVHVEFALSEVDYFAGILGDTAQALIAWQDYCLGHAEWFLSPQGRDFVQRLQAGATA